MDRGEGSGALGLSVILGRRQVHNYVTELDRQSAPDSHQIRTDSARSHVQFVAYL